MPSQVRESKTVLDSKFHAVDFGCRYWISVLVSGTWIWIPIVSVISDSLSCIADFRGGGGLSRGGGGEGVNQDLYSHDEG